MRCPDWFEIYIAKFGQKNMSSCKVWACAPSLRPTSQLAPCNSMQYSSRGCILISLLSGEHNTERTITDKLNTVLIAAEKQGTYISPQSIDLGVCTTVQITILSTSLCVDDFWYWNKALTLTSLRIPRLRLRRNYSIIVKRLKLPATLEPIDFLGKSAILSQKNTNTFTIGINNT